MAKYLAMICLGLAAIQQAAAAGTAYPEVIPGPGLPSLASLNLTSADLYETAAAPPAVKGSKKMMMRGTSEAAAALERRWFNVCDPSTAALAPKTDITACYNYLASLPSSQACAVSAGTTVEMCRSGEGHVTGQGVGGVAASQPWSVPSLGLDVLLRCCLSVV